VHGIKCDFSSNNHYQETSMKAGLLGWWLWLFFLYGGTSFNGHQNLWVYNNVSNEWAWISGDSIFNSSAVSGTQGVSSLNKPGLRTGATAGRSVRQSLALRWIKVLQQWPVAICTRLHLHRNGIMSEAPQINFSVSDSQLCENLHQLLILQPTILLHGFGFPRRSSFYWSKPNQYLLHGTGHVWCYSYHYHRKWTRTLTLSNYITVIHPHFQPSRKLTNTSIGPCKFLSMAT
jgi:hypothetical protein